MRDLQEIQNNLQQYLLHKNVSSASQIMGTKNASAIQRLAIYRDGYYLRLLEVLQQDYEVLHGLMQDDAFDQLGREFIDACPSQFRSIRWYGNALPDFMRKNPLYQKEPWLIEMAEFEWMLTESFDAADSSLVTFEKMATIPMQDWPAMCFRLLPSVRKLNLHWNVIPIWKTFKEEGVLLQFERMPTAATWIIWRKGLDTLFHSLPSDAAYMLDAMNAGISFGTICEGLCTWVDEEEVAMHAALLLKRFILDNLIAEIYFNDVN